MSDSTALSRFRISTAEVLAFAESSGDSNPLHVSPAYAATTPFGGVICHGALAAMTALAQSGVRPGAGSTVNVTFNGAVSPDMDYSLQVEHHDREADPDEAVAEIAVRDGQRTLLRMRVTRSTVRTDRAGDDAGALHIAGIAPDVPAISSALSSKTGTEPLPSWLVLGFATVSTIAGMHYPGTQALLRSISVVAPDRDPHGEPYVVTLQAPSTASEARGLARIEATISDSAGPVMGVSGTALRRPVTVNLPPTGPRSQELDGHLSIVIGSSRGLGWAVARELDHRGAAVVGIQRTPPTNPTQSSAEEDPASRVEVHAADARDDSALAAIASRIVESRHDVDSLFLVGTGVLRDSWVDHVHASRIAEYVTSEIALVLNPLTRLLPLIRPGGQVVFASTSVLGEGDSLDPLPRAAGWPHYSAAKAAGEALLRVVALEYPEIRVRILRLPALATALISPSGVHRLVEPAEVAREIASAIVTGSSRLPYEID